MNGALQAIDPIIQPDQAVRFTVDYSTDYPMTYAEEESIMNNLNYQVAWDGGDLVESVRSEIMLYDVDDWQAFLCSLTRIE